MTVTCEPKYTLLLGSPVNELTSTLSYHLKSLLAFRKKLNVVSYKTV